MRWIKMEPSLLLPLHKEEQTSEDEVYDVDGAPKTEISHQESMRTLAKKALFVEKMA